MDFELVQMPNDRAVAARMGMLAASASAGASAKVHGDFDSLNASDDFIDHLHRNRGGSVRIGILLADVGVNEEAEVRIVDLSDVSARISHQFQFAAKYGDAGANKIVALGISAR